MVQTLAGIADDGRGFDFSACPYCTLDSKKGMTDFLFLMNSSGFKKIVESLGRSDLEKTPPRATRFQNRLLLSFVCFFVLAAFGADLWPCKKFYFASQGWRQLPFYELGQIRLALRYSSGNSGLEGKSLAYMVLLKFFYAVIPHRLLCLRVISILVSCISIFFLYRLSVILFSRSVGLIFTFILVTSPIYLESMRSFGFHPLTHMVVIMACYFLAASLNNRLIIIKTALLALFCLLTLSLYLVGRMIIFLPIIFFGLYWKKDCPKLLLFLFFFIIFILALDVGLNDASFSFHDLFINNLRGEWLSKSGEVNSFVLPDYLGRNLKLAIDYLTNHDRKPFAAFEKRSQLFNVVYTPFLFIGFLVCLWRRRRGNVILLLLFFLFFVMPVGSSALVPRRFLLSLYPLYLMIALGLWSVFILFLRISSSRIYRLGLAYFSLTLLALTGGWGGYEFIFKVARPHYNYSLRQLKKIAEFIEEEGNKFDSIRFNDPTRDLIWGNPYLAKRPERSKVARKIGMRSSNHLRSLLTTTLQAGESLLYLYTFPLTTARYSKEHYDTLYAGIEWGKENFSDIFFTSTIIGTDLHYILLQKSKDIPLNLLQAEKVKLTSSSPPIYSQIDEIIEGDEDVKWKIAPDRTGEPLWLMFDFGEGNDKIVRYVTAVPAKGSLDHFFGNAALFGSIDGKTWELVTRITQREKPRAGEWRKWVFENERSYRYYKFVVYDVLTKAQENFFALVNLALFEGKDDRQFWLK